MNRFICIFLISAISFSCASIGCPSLIPQPFHGTSLQQQLDSVTILFIKDPIRSQIDFPTHTLLISEIFLWLKAGFVMKGINAGDDRAIIDFIAKYINSSQTEIFTKIKDRDIEHLPYGWSLNIYQP